MLSIRRVTLLLGFFQDLISATETYGSGSVFLSLSNQPSSLSISSGNLYAATSSGLVYAYALHS